MSQFNFRDIKDEVANLGAKLTLDMGDGVGRLEFKGKSGNKLIPVTKSGRINEDDVDKLAKELSRLGAGEQSEIYSLLTKPPYEKRAVNYSLILLSLVTIVLTFSRAGIFTGNIVSEASNLTTDMIIIFCLIGLLVGFIWKLKLK